MWFVTEWNSLYDQDTSYLIFWRLIKIIFYFIRDFSLKNIYIVIFVFLLMKTRKKKSSGSLGFEISKLKSKNAIIVSVVVIIIGLVGLYYFGIFGSVSECGDMACYYESLGSCKKSYVVNEDENYVYRYEILNVNGNSYCDVDVRLMKVKDGGPDSAKLEGLNMVCRVNRFGEMRPEDDMLVCSGRLREELQEIIIDRMHNQILQNWEEVQKGLVG